MGLVCQYKCADIIFDVYDIDRICTSTGMTTNNLFFVTPSRVVKIEKYLIENDISKITSPEQMEFLIDNNYIGIY